MAQQCTMPVLSQHVSQLQNRSSINSSGNALDSLALQEAAYLSMLSSSTHINGLSLPSLHDSSCTFWSNPMQSASIHLLGQPGFHAQNTCYSSHVSSIPTQGHTTKTDNFLATLLQAQGLSTSQPQPSTSHPLASSPSSNPSSADHSPWHPVLAFNSPSHSFQGAPLPSTSSPLVSSKETLSTLSNLLSAPSNLSQADLDASLKLLAHLATSSTPTCSSPPLASAPSLSIPPSTNVVRSAAHDTSPAAGLSPTTASSPDTLSTTSSSSSFGNFLMHPSFHPAIFSTPAGASVAPSDVSDASTDTLKGGSDSEEQYLDEEVQAAAWERSRTLAVLGIKYDGVVSAELRRAVGAPFQNLKGFVGVYMPAMSLRSCKTNRRSRSFAFIKFSTPDAAAAALACILRVYPDGSVPIVLPASGGKPLMCQVERVQEKNTADLVQKYRSFVKSCQRLGLYHLLA